MTKLEEILQGIIADIDEAFGCAVVDMNTRQVLGVAHRLDFLTPSFLEALAAVAVEMIRGKHIRAVETLLSGKLDNPITNTVTDFCISAENTRHFMAIVPDNPNLLVVLSTGKNTIVAMGWIVINRNMGFISQNCP